jgi:hypothetical protein
MKKQAVQERRRKKEIAQLQKVLANLVFIRGQVKVLKEVVELKKARELKAKSLVRRLVRYMWEDEAKSYNEVGRPKNHIFETLQALNEHYQFGFEDEWSEN